MFTLSWPAAFGLYLQAQGIWDILRLMPSRPEVESMGLGFLARNLLSERGEPSQWLIYQAIPLGLTLVLILFGLCFLPVVERLWRLIRSIGAARSSRGRFSAPAGRGEVRSNPAPFRGVLIAFGLMFALAGLMPRSLFAKANVGFVQPKRSAHPAERPSLVVRKTPPAAGQVYALISSATPTATPAPTLTQARTEALLVPTPAPTPTPRPIKFEQLRADRTMVQVRWSPARAHFVLMNKNGELFTIRGVNYNTHYTQLPKEEQLRILRRDFMQMQQAGVNVVTGFGSFDETTLQVAQEYEIYVIMPFVPDLNGNYLDAGYRDQVKQEFAAFIKRYENYPALLMWNFDDEPLHNMAERLQRPADQVQAFSDFLFELAEYGYETDRFHRPSWLKEPRDWYLDILDQSIQKARNRARSESAQKRPVSDPNQYVVLARSAYGAPLDIQDWLPKLTTNIERGLDMPFAVGEYGVLGIDPAERSYHLVQILKEASHDSSIGTAVYTYGPFQPHPNDLTDPGTANQLKLVDENGNPSDDSWAKLSEVWLAQQAEEKTHRLRSSIPLAVPAFQAVFEQSGGYPSSGPIEEDLVIRQFFVEGKKDGHPIAYVLSWNGATDRVEFIQVDRVVFNELGDYSLSGLVLQEYMKNGGYARFGSPVSDPRPLQGDGSRLIVQEFAKGWTSAQEIAHVGTSP
jgi:hypothetical protein